MKRTKTKFVAVCTTAAMLVTSILPVLADPVVDAVKPNAVTTPYFYYDFEDLAEQTLPSNMGGFGLGDSYKNWYVGRAGTNASIVDDGLGHGKVLKMDAKNSQLYHWMSDIPAMSDPNTTDFVVQWDMKISDLSEGWRIEPLMTLPANRNGSFVPPASYNGSYWGKIKSNEWNTIAVKIHKTPAATSGYYVLSQTLYVNGIMIYANAYMSNTDKMFDLNFHDDGTPQSPGSSLYLDNFKAYKGAFEGEVPAPQLPLKAAWFEENFDNISTSDITLTGATGFLGLPAPYQNYYMERGYYYDTTDPAAGSAEFTDGVLKVTHNTKDVTLYRFADDNVGPDFINNGQTFTYELDTKVTGDYYWDLGFQVNTSYGTIANREVARLNYPANEIFPVLDHYQVDTWQHLAIEVNQANSTCRVYRNGVLENESKYEGSVGLSSIKAFMIQSRFGSSDKTGTIEIDNFKGYLGSYYNPGDAGYRYLAGDTNKDGELNLLDLPKINGNANLTQEEKFLADVNKDGVVSPDDNLEFHRYIYGYSTTITPWPYAYMVALPGGYPVTETFAKAGNTYRQYIKVVSDDKNGNTLQINAQDNPVNLKIYDEAGNMIIGPVGNTGETMNFMFQSGTYYVELYSSSPISADQYSVYLKPAK